MTDDLAPLIARLDRQAAAIKDLRVRVAALEASGESVPAAGWQPPTTCAMCGEVKPPSRAKTMTCRPCSIKRTDMIKSGDVKPLQRSTCHACGDTFARSARLFCAPCSAKFKVWKATN